MLYVFLRCFWRTLKLMLSLFLRGVWRIKGCMQRGSRVQSSLAE
jgi:hypothetical protein